MTPLPRPLKALGVAGIAASLMLAPLPAHAEGNNLYRNPSKFYTGAVSDCLLDKQYGRGQIADIWAYCNGFLQAFTKFPIVLPAEWTLSLLYTV